jgi:hypothetical protein
MNRDERLHTSVLVGPHGERRKNRKARHRAAAQIHSAARATRQAKERAKWEAEKA